MTTIRRHRTIAGRTLIVGLLFLAGLAAQTAAVTAHDGWVRLPAPSKSETAFYVELENHGAQPRAVVAVSSDAADKAEMHKMMMEGDMMGMMPIDKVAIPANGKASLSPNGMHVMLFGLKKKLAAGDKVTVTLKLDDGSSVPVTAIVKK
jgi:copper(I)-binding protein